MINKQVAMVAHAARSFPNALLLGVLIGFVLAGWGAAHLIVANVWYWEGPVWPLHVGITSLAVSLFGLSIRDQRGALLAGAGALFASAGFLTLFVLGTAKGSVVLAAWPLVFPGAPGLGLLAWAVLRGDIDLTGTGVRMVFGALALYLPAILLYAVVTDHGTRWMEFSEVALSVLAVIAGAAISLGSVVVGALAAHRRS